MTLRMIMLIYAVLITIHYKDYILHPDWTTSESYRFAVMYVASTWFAALPEAAVMILTTFWMVVSLVLFTIPVWIYRNCCKKGGKYRKQIDG